MKISNIKMFLVTFTLIIEMFTFNMLFAAQKSFKEINASKESEKILSINENSLKSRFAVNYTNRNDLRQLKDDTLIYGAKSVPVLIEVMKTSSYPDKNRWMATFLLGKIVGKKSAPFIAKFLEHPNWIMKTASLKTLLALNQKEYGTVYAKLLQDDSMVVRTQALENIRALKLDEHASNVWSMLYDKRNYYIDRKGNSAKRANILKQVVRTIGELKYNKVKGHLSQMAQKERYNDIFHDIDYALMNLTDKKSPGKTISEKRVFWAKNLNVKI